MPAGLVPASSVLPASPKLSSRKFGNFQVSLFCSSMKTHFCLSQMPGAALSHFTLGRFYFVFCLCSFIELAQIFLALFPSSYLSCFTSNFARFRSKSFLTPIRLSPYRSYKYGLGTKLGKADAHSTALPMASLSIFSQLSVEMPLSHAPPLSATVVLLAEALSALASTATTYRGKKRSPVWWLVRLLSNSNL